MFTSDLIAEGKPSLCPSTLLKYLIRRVRTSATSLSASTLTRLVLRPLLHQLQSFLRLLLNPRPPPLCLQQRQQHRRESRVLASMKHLRRCLQALGFKRPKHARTYLDYSPDYVCVDCHCRGLLRYALLAHCQHIVCVFCLDDHACLQANASQTLSCSYA